MDFRPGTPCILYRVLPVSFSEYRCTFPILGKYNSEVRLQNSGQVVEVIEKMEEMTKSLILKFQQNSGHWPRKIIFYRDGVSEGQFIDVLNHELMAIRRACKSLEQKRGKL